ncbi:WYL domain-containing protein [Azospirillum argentinense]|uniref:WYL domain-containing protein n=1 Tax=Azospirillum brasilense TaxID=192 RepID=A0A4D8QCY8_AZOBR|nr:WYL domain-containing protein [Azospirillum argentinense]QCO07564.1 WYL domain-containing protein [Azospirillum argentinense]
MPDILQIAELVSRTSDIPPTIAGGFVTIGLDDVDDPDEILADEADDLTSALAGVTIAIEYIDSKGAASRRRISIRKFSHDGKSMHLQAYCLERRALRCFRVDRIRAVIDLDGEVHDDPVQFFRDELLVIEEDEPEIPAMAQLEAAQAGVTVLAALAHADGVLDLEEVGVILDYIAERADREGIATTEEDRAMLAPLVRRQVPSRDDVMKALRKIVREGKAGQRLLLRSAVQLMDADGVHHPAEFALLVSIQQELGA